MIPPAALTVLASQAILWSIVAGSLVLGTALNWIMKEKDDA